MTRLHAADLRGAPYAALSVLRWMPQGWPALRTKVGCLDAETVARGLSGGGVRLSCQAREHLVDLTAPRAERALFQRFAESEATEWNLHVADYAVHAGPARLVMGAYAQLWIVKAAMRLAAWSILAGGAKPGAEWRRFGTWFDLACARTGAPTKAIVSSLHVDPSMLRRWRRGEVAIGWGSLQRISAVLLKHGYPRGRCVPLDDVSSELVVGALVCNWARHASNARLAADFVEVHDGLLASEPALARHAQFGATGSEFLERVASRLDLGPLYITGQALAKDERLAPGLRHLCAHLHRPTDYLRERFEIQIEWSEPLARANDCVLRASVAPAAQRRQLWKEALALCEREIDERAPYSWLTFAYAYALQRALTGRDRKDWRNQVQRLSGWSLERDESRAFLLNWSARPSNVPLAQGESLLRVCRSFAR